jgi:ABC-2 type transport system ATP-binding protein
MFAIEISGFQKTYRVGFLQKKERVALKALSLAVNEGEIFGFLGPNGAGKTTTLKLLMGLIFPTAGSAKILGFDWREPQVRAQIGYLPEQPYFYEYLTAVELLDYLARLSAVPEPERRKRIPAILGRVGLSEAGRLQLRKFSKGMLQRVGIAQAILHDPKVVFLDEPTSGLDPLGRREVRDLMQSLKEEGKTVFFSTHILSDAEALCDRVAVIHKGELRGIGVTADLTARANESTEIIWIGTTTVSVIKALATNYYISADTTRAVIPSGKVPEALDAIRQQKGQLISVVPVRATLEDYFMERLSEETTTAVSLQGQT